MQLDTPGATVKGPAATFTGDVYVTPMHAAQPPSRLTAALVRFTPGARSFWHHHGLGQRGDHPLLQHARACRVLQRRIQGGGKLGEILRVG